MRLPWVSIVAYDLALAQLAALQERNDRLVEAVSQPGAVVTMPRQVVEIEPSVGWWDNKPASPRQPVAPRIGPVIRSPQGD
jgi:hypothetical protein